MRTTLILFFVICAVGVCKAQDNCNVYLWEGDTAKYNACEYLQNAPNYFQLKLEHHAIRDSAIRIAPHYDYPYWSKSIAFLKTGDFIEWKKLIDKAVSLNESRHLGYRGWCRFQFFRDYKGAIADLERLERLMGTTDIGVCQSGDYHLQVAKALCYKMIGYREKAIVLIEDQIAADPDFVGVFDYFHLGVLYLEVGRLEDAKIAFLEQEKLNPLAETSYYQSQLSINLGDNENAILLAETSLERYQSMQLMYDPYSHAVDKIYQIQIEELIEKIRMDTQ